MHHASLEPKSAMRALRCAGGAVRLERGWPIPLLAPGEALIRVTLAGVCATDLAILDGYAGFDGTLGHEFTGRVVAAPDAPEWVGRRVVGAINVACGRCSACLRLERSHCLERRVIGIRGRDGAFADFLTLPVANLHQVPDGVSDRCAVFVEPLAAALEILEQTPVRPTDRVVVVGDGRLGLLVAQVLALTGCEIRVLGRHPRKLEILAARGIPVALAESPDLAGWADLAVACGGGSEGLGLARRLVRPRGRLVVKSTLPGVAPFDMNALVVEEITLIGSRCGPFPAALRLLAAGRVEVEPLIDAVYSLEEGIGALTRAAGRGALKILIQP